MNPSTTPPTPMQELTLNQLQGISGGTVVTPSNGAVPVATTGNSTLMSDGTIQLHPIRISLPIEQPFAVR